MKILDKAEKKAKQLFPYVFDTYRGGRTFHFAFAFCRSQLIDYGINSYEADSRIHKLGIKHNIRKYSKYAMAHAEADLVTRLLKYPINNKYNIVCIRLNRFFHIGNARPCVDCRCCLSLLKIKKIYYSTPNGWLLDSNT